MSGPIHHSSAPSADTPKSAKSPRVLSCLLCQQRKVRCNREFPCINCIKAEAECVPANVAQRPRKRRFPERELLEKLRQYDGLLRQNNINFDPLHGYLDSQSVPLNGPKDRVVNPDDRNTTPASSATTSERPLEAKNFWDAINQVSPESDKDSNRYPADIDETVVKKTWDHLFENKDPLLSSRKTVVDLSQFHPEPAQISRLWQIYLDNVNPLLKVTHTPTLLSRIIEVIGNLKGVSPALEALMFSIYCVAILTLGPDECVEMLGSSQPDLLAKYQACCQQALEKCGFLRSDELDCLTALYLYLVSFRPGTDPRTLCSMLGIAIRVAQRMGLLRESTSSRCPPLEAELRRRLWWALVLFDTRIGEMADYKSTVLTPLWDCKTPLNVNDFDLRPEMKEPPAIQGRLSEALFVVVRGELGDFLRHSTFHLDFTVPALKSVARETRHRFDPKSDELATVERMLEEKYLQFCDSVNPLHFFTIWTTRAFLAKCRLLEHYSRHSTAHQTEVQRDAAINHALCMLDCDTKLLSSTATTPFLWFMHFHFSFPAYVHILQDLKRRPFSMHVGQAWDLMSDNFEARATSFSPPPNPLFRTFSAIILHAWEVCEGASKQSGHSPQVPKVVSIIKEHSIQDTGLGRLPNATDTSDAPGAGSSEADIGFHSLLNIMGGEGIDTDREAWLSLGMLAHPPGSGLGQLDWPQIHWGL